MDSPHKPVDLTGVVDLHVHSAPDLRARGHHDLQLAEQAVQIGAGAFVIKSHLVPTMDRAWLIGKLYPQLRVFGSITLNPSVGGINPYAVESALQLGAKIVWLPTIFSTRHREIEGKSGGVASVAGRKVVPLMTDVLRLIAEHRAILGTGHLSPEDIFVVVEEARRLGVERIVVTHPESYTVRMSVQDQRTLADQYGVLLERCYAQPLGNGQYRLNHEDNLRAIEQVGWASTILSTDGGQPDLPPWRQMLAESIQYLAGRGIPEAAIASMTRTTPAGLLELQSHE